jgi:manganese-dependent ADP-ribose/CDP-alcohol diphosphatase
MAGTGEVATTVGIAVDPGTGEGKAGAPSVPNRNSGAAEVATPRKTTLISENSHGSPAGAAMTRSSFLRFFGAGTLAPGVVTQAAGNDEVLRFGLLTDCQYADSDTPPGGLSSRFYRRSPQKLADEIARFNAMPDLEFLVHLGDAIDRDERSFGVVMPIFRSSRVPVLHVAGNHDYSVADALKEKVPSLLGMPSPFYRRDFGRWRLLMLDGNAVSLFAWPEGSPQHAEALAFRKAAGGALPDYNGGMGGPQLLWLRSELAEARGKGLRCLLCCHYPLLPQDGHVLWDAPAGLELLREFKDVVAAWFNGHNHAGGYASSDGIHFLTFRGMVEKDSSAAARIECCADRIVVTGFGREPSRILPLPAGA